MRQFAISDIHGHTDKLSNLLDQFKLSKDDELYLLGDYVDRGPDSKGVIDTIWKLQKEGYTVKCLRGNHEQMLLNAISNEQEELFWLRNGGVATLKSFGVEAVGHISTSYLDFLNALPYYFLTDQYCFVHAGLNFQELNPFSDIYQMLWIRNWYKDHKPTMIGNRILVHGHTPITKTAIWEMVAYLKRDRRLNIDNGGFRLDFEMGNLCGVELEARKLYFSK